MEKPNIVVVKKLFEDNGWTVEVMYQKAKIRMDAKKENDDFVAVFPYRQEDLTNSQLNQLSGAAEQALWQEIQAVQEDFAERYCDYNGSPAGVQLYESQYGVSSAAAVQTVSAGRFPFGNHKNLKLAEQKSVAMVEAAFKKAGYQVEIGNDKKGTWEEEWHVACSLTNPITYLMAVSFGDAKAAKRYARSFFTLKSAKSQNWSLKTQDLWVYYGQQRAIELFESLGGGAITTVFQAKEEKRIEEVAVKVGKDDLSSLEETLKSYKYLVTVSVMEKFTMVSGMNTKDIEDRVFAFKYSSEQAAKEGGANMNVVAGAMDREPQYRGNWFYYGSARGMSIVESIIQ